MTSDTGRQCTCLRKRPGRRAGVFNCGGVVHLVSLLILLFVIAPPCLLSAAQPDSTALQYRDSVVILPGVEVAAPRVRASVARPEVNISRAEIERLPLSSTADALELSPGVFVKRYGGLGGIQTLSLRGSTAPQTLLLLDGVRLNSVQSGAVDLALLPLALVEEIQVVRGGGAALHGGNALGGLVNVRTRLLRQSPQLGASLERASFNEWRAAAWGGARFGAFQLNSSLTLEESDGDYPFDFNQFGSEVQSRRGNGDAAIHAGMLNMQWVRERLRLFAATILRSAERGSPGAVVQGRIEDASARLLDDGLIAYGGAELVGQRWRGGLLFNVRRNDQTYLDPEFFGPDPAEHTFNFSEREIGAALNLAANFAGHELDARLELTAAELRGDQLQNLEGDRAQRDHAAAALRAAGPPIHVGRSEIRLETALRLDAYDDFGSVLSPSFGLAWTHLPADLTLRADLSDNFRPPSFNELYYINYGSADLRPERGLSINLGVDWEHDGLSVTLDAFLLRTRDQIIAVPRSPVSWSARNVGRVHSRGLELTVRGSWFDGRLRTSVAGTVQQAVDESPESFSRGEDIVYTPGELLNVSASWTQGAIAAGCVYALVGERLSLPGAAAEDIMPAYGLADLFVEVGIDLGGSRLTTRLQAKNVFGEEYAVLRNYPMPGRSVSVRLAWNVH